MPVAVNADTLSLLRSVPYFRPLDERDLELVAQEVAVRSYAVGAMVFLEGEAGAGLHLVAEGLCKVYRLSVDGREQVLAVLGPGDSCNEVPAVDGGPNPASLVSIEHSTLWVLPGEALSRLRQGCPSLDDIIINSLAMRCRQLVQRVYNLSFLSVTGRLAAFLLQQVDESSQLNRQQWTQDEIAAHLGTVREMVSRAFRDLQEAELIAIQRHRIEILDRVGLEELT
ncbi:MAG: Crp/Fnr family transcriptional regulator [Anaerolineales bacterium]|nr:MAG: Crp/Fnr family transcriptional regulator [Anaerolineales bacterium]